MYKLANAVTSIMIAASSLIVIGVVLYSIVLAINESAAPRGQVQVSEISQAQVPALADANVDVPTHGRLAL